MYLAAEERAFPSFGHLAKLSDKDTDGSLLQVTGLGLAFQHILRITSTGGRLGKSRRSPMTTPSLPPSDDTSSNSSPPVLSLSHTSATGHCSALPEYHLSRQALFLSETCHR